MISTVELSSSLPPPALRPARLSRGKETDTCTPTGRWLQTESGGDRVKRNGALGEDGASLTTVRIAGRSPMFPPLGSQVTRTSLRAASPASRARTIPSLQKRCSAVIGDDVEAPAAMGRRDNVPAEIPPLGSSHTTDSGIGNRPPAGTVARSLAPVRGSLTTISTSNPQRLTISHADPTVTTVLPLLATLTRHISAPQIRTAPARSGTCETVAPCSTVIDTVGTV